LPLAHLQLGVRARSACLASGCRTIFDVEYALLSGKLAGGGIGGQTRDELVAAVSGVGRLRGSDNEIDWDRVWAWRGVSLPGLAMTSRSLERLAPPLRNKGLGMLSLKKACSGLEGAGVSTVGALIRAARNGIGRLPNFGKVAQQEVVAALMALSQSITPTGAVDWEIYATACGFTLLPTGSAAKGGAKELLGALSTLGEKIVRAQMNSRAWEIFNHRFLAPEQSRRTLQQLGDVYGVSRELVRQIEEKCLAAVRKPVLEDDYRGLQFRLRESTLLLFRNGRSHFKSLRRPAWTESRWLAELAAFWGVGENDARRYGRLLIATLGFEWHAARHPTLDALVIDASASVAESERLIDAVVKINDTLRAHCQGLDSVALLRALKSQGVKSFGLEDVPKLVELCSAAEVAPGSPGVARTKFVFLQSRADQAVRVLLETGAILSHRDLAREINLRLPESRRLKEKNSLVNHMAKDHRLVAIGESGDWALAEWAPVSRYRNRVPRGRSGKRPNQTGSPAPSPGGGAKRRQGRLP